VGKAEGKRALRSITVNLKKRGDKEDEWTLLIYSRNQW
jgi:hypothetical protein